MGRVGGGGKVGRAAVITERRVARMRIWDDDGMMTLAA